MIRKAELEDKTAISKLHYMAAPNVFTYFFASPEQRALTMLEQLYEYPETMFSKDFFWVHEEDGKIQGVICIFPGKDKKVLEKKHDVAWSGWSTSLRPQYWEHFHSINAHKPQTNNITNTDDPDMDQLIDAYRNSLDEEERIKLSVKIQEKIHEIGAFVPTFMVPYLREAYWRWWRLPRVPGTKHSGSLFDPFSSSTGGLFWLDKKLYEETKKAMKKKKTFSPVTIIDKTYKAN